MPTFDRFDICEAYYIYLASHHEGMGSRKYERLCRLLSYFDPRPSLRDVFDLTENGYAIYNTIEMEDQLTLEL